jgi:hypothetical protein
MGPAGGVNSKRYRNIAGSLPGLRRDNAKSWTHQKSDGCKPSLQISVAPMLCHTLFPSMRRQPY